MAFREHALDINRHYRRLHAVVALDDRTSETTPTSLKVVTDGRAHSYAARAGKPVSLDLDVGGVLRLGLEVDFPDRDEVTVAVGDPWLET